MACLDAESRGYRFLVLFFNCLLTFGSYYCFDMPSVLQAVFQGDPCNSTHNHTLPDKELFGSVYLTEKTNKTNGTCCKDCLGMSPYEYNLLYVVYSWTNAVVVIIAGFLIDKLGNRFGVLLFSSLCVIGSSTFALGAYLKGTSYLLPILLVGRLIFGAGNGSLTIVQNRITAFWFKDKELAMAFGFTLALSRLGSVLNFLLTRNIEGVIGLQWTLWLGAMLCGLGFICAITVSALDVWGVKQLGEDETQQSESKKLRISDITKFSVSFWLLCLAIMTFYNGVFPFVADASKFIQDKYGFHENVSAYLAGAVYYVSLFLSPFLGGVIDVFGKRGYLALLCALFSIPVFGLLAFTKVYPLVSTLWLGVTYSFAAASMWPSIPLVVAQATIGTAMGITTSIQMIGIGVSNLVVGEILGDKDTQDKSITVERWKYVMIFLLANTIACVVVCAALNLRDKSQGGILNKSKKERNAANLMPAINEDPSETDPLLFDNRRAAIN